MESSPSLQKLPFLSIASLSLNDEMNSRQFPVKFLNPSLLPISRVRAEMGCHVKSPPTTELVDFLFLLFFFELVGFSTKLVVRGIVPIEQFISQRTK